MGSVGWGWIATDTLICVLTQAVSHQDELLQALLGPPGIQALQEEVLSTATVGGCERRAPRQALQADRHTGTRMYAGGASAAAYGCVMGPCTWRVRVCWYGVCQQVMCTC